MSKKIKSEQVYEDAVWVHGVDHFEDGAKVPWIRQKQSARDVIAYFNRPVWSRNYRPVS